MHDSAAVRVTERGLSKHEAVGSERSFQVRQLHPRTRTRPGRGDRSAPRATGNWGRRGVAVNSNLHKRVSPHFKAPAFQVSGRILDLLN